MNVTIKLFREYLTQSISRNYLSQINKTSRTTLWRKFDPLLEVRLLPLSNLTKVRVIAVDGFYLSYPSLKRNRHKDGFKKDKCILLWALDCENHKPIYWQFYDEIENMRIWKSFIYEMKVRNFNPEYLVSDGHLGITSACSDYWPAAKQQRCIAHFMSNMNKDLSISPKTNIAKDLKLIVALLFKIKTIKERVVWEEDWLNYLEKYKDTILLLKCKKDVYEGTQRIPSGYLSALSVVSCAYKKDEIFTYLKDSKVPNTSNSIESINGVLRELTRRHRGMSLERRKNLITWVLACRQGQTDVQLKQQISINRSKKSTLFET